MKKKLDLHPEARILFTYFYNNYPPAKDVKETKIFMSTQSVYERLRLLKPLVKEHYTIDDVKGFLESAGYVLDRMGNGDTDFRWLVKYC